MQNVYAIFKKQLKDTLKNKTVLIQFVMFPVLTLIMNRAISIADMPENFFVNMFAVMYMGMAPLTSMAAIIAEEKEKNTLRVLMMANVKPYEYLLGTGGYVWLLCMLGTFVICLSAGYDVQIRFVFMGIMALGIFVSLLAGAAIGTWSKTQMMATSVTVPVTMVLSFLPLLSMFNATIAKIAKFTYMEQISQMLHQINGISFDTENIIIVVVNVFAVAALFVTAYKKCRLA